MTTEEEKCFYHLNTVNGFLSFIKQRNPIFHIIFISIHIMSKVAVHVDMEHYGSLHHPIKTDWLELLSAGDICPPLPPDLILQFILHLRGGGLLVRLG